MASQDSESLLKKNNQEKKYWAILGKGSISKLLLEIMIIIKVNQFIIKK